MAAGLGAIVLGETQLVGGGVEEHADSAHGHTRLREGGGISWRGQEGVWCRLFAHFELLGLDVVDGGRHGLDVVCGRAASVDVVAEYTDFSGDLRQDGAEAVDLAVQFSHHGGGKIKGFDYQDVGN
jgi:hypothetical protein